MRALITMDLLHAGLKPMRWEGNERSPMTLEEWLTSDRYDYSLSECPSYSHAIELVCDSTDFYISGEQDYQGTQIACFAHPAGQVYLWVIGYGSCSGCDAMEAASDGGPEALLEEYNHYLQADMVFASIEDAIDCIEDTVCGLRDGEPPRWWDKETIDGYEGAIAYLKEKQNDR